MDPLRSRIVLLLSALLLVAVGAAWLLWPDDGGAADLEPVAAVATTTTTSAPTATTAAATLPSTTTTTTAPPPAAITEPVRLRIPAVGVDAPVVPVGIRSDGQMEVPGASDVGWYRLGPPPGAGGSAVLAAHVDFGGQRGAFFDLRSVPVGAEVLVDGNGTTRRFVVAAREQIPKADIELARYFTAEGPARLTLITCGGAFDHGTGHYQDNIVLTAEPAP